MGHKGDIEATYSTGKQLTEERIEDIEDKKKKRLQEKHQ